VVTSPGGGHGWAAPPGEANWGDANDGLSPFSRFALLLVVSRVVLVIFTVAYWREAPTS